MRIAAVFALFLAFLAQPAPAQQGNSGGILEKLEEIFKRLDRDGDGKLAREDLPAGYRNQFETIDADGDGFATFPELRKFFMTGASRRAPPKPAEAGSASEAPEPAGPLGVLAAAVELRARDVEASAKFYAVGLGMRRLESPLAPGEALLEWAGTYIRIRPAKPGAPPPAAEPLTMASGMRQLLAVNGLRWFSLWFADPAAAAERIAKAGYPAPVRGPNVSFARDPDGNLVEIMGIPRDADRETFTVGMLASDEAASAAFFRDALGLREFAPWNLPPPVSVKMLLFETGLGRVKFADPAGDRPLESKEGEDAPGIRAVCLWVEDLAAAQTELARRKTVFQEASEGAGGAARLVLKDPDGNRFPVEPAPAFLAPTGAPGEPRLKALPDCDAVRDAAGRGQLFECVRVRGITDLVEGTNGIAIADLDRDGRLDLVATYSAPRGSGGSWGQGEKLRVFLNRGNFRFEERKIRILDSKVSQDAFGRGQVPVLADFNRDGFLDLFVTRHAQMTAGESNPRDQRSGNGLYVTEGAWDVFRDVSAKMGIQNEKAYNRQPSFGDVNRDGWLDVAVGCDNIGNAMGGVPHSRLYVFKPGGAKFGDGRFEDVGGTELVPDFGGFYHDSAKDKSGPDVNLRDLDNDGDLDLVQSYHVDIRDPALPYSPVEYRQGVFCWKNLLAETGELRFEKVENNGLACSARLKLGADGKSFEPIGKAPGLPYISLADADNDGLLDVLAVGPASRGWAPRAEYVGGRFWRNLGGFRFEERTKAAGLGALEWTYEGWIKFYEIAAEPGRRTDRPYFADAIFGDFDNDGWVDLVVQDRSETTRGGEPTRASLFMNRGDGAFELKPTTFSGLDGNGICGEAADLNNDGLLDLVFAADPDNSGLAMSSDRWEDKVYWNTGLHGARENRWLRLRFSGVSEAGLIGARVEALEAGTGKLIGLRAVAANHSYKSGGALEAHFGLGKRDAADLRVTLPDGKKVEFKGMKANRFLNLDVAAAKAAEVEIR